MTVALLSCLPGLRTKALGRELIHVAECGSSNDRAAELAMGTNAHGLVVLAEHQSAGRGRLGRRWLSPPGSNLLFSVVLGPVTPPLALAERVGNLTLAMGLGVSEGLDAAGAGGSRLKWPNDVQFSGRKVAGILCERREDVVVAGVGINVNAAPPDDQIDRPATSIAKELGREVDRFAILARVLEAVERRWEMALAADLSALQDDYRARCVTVGQTVRVDAGGGAGAGEMVEGVAEGIDAFGCLQVRTTGGELRAVAAGDVSELP